MAGWTVVLRGIGYRSGRSMMVLGLAALATAATVLAPAYSRAAQQSVLSDRLASAPVSATSLHVRSDPLAGEAPTIESTSEAKLELRLMLARRSDLADHLELPIGGADLETVATAAGAAGTGVLARLAYRDFVCGRLTITAGECAEETGTVVVSERSAREYGLRVGTSLTVRSSAPAVGSAANRFRSVTISGLYEPKDVSDAYWGRGGYFAAGSPSSESSLPRLDAIFVADEQDLILPASIPSVHLDYRLRVPTVRLDNLAPLRAALTGFETDVNARQMQLVTALRGALDDIDAEAAALGRTIPVVAVPLVLVCWFVLYLLVAALTEERSPEVALAKLRGFSMSRAARFGRAEALVLVLLAVPVGVAAGLALVEAAARTMLAPGVHVEPRWPVLAAAGVATAAAIVAVRLASRQVLARPVLALLRRVPERGRWQAGVAEGAVVALAGASLAVAASDQTAPLALLAPALLAVVAGILTARLLGLWSRARVSRHARKGRLTGVLAHAQLSRRSLGHRLMLVLTVAVALLSFAATAWDVAAQARDDVAADTVGADRVVVVGASDPVAFVAAVEAAGAQAMPVVRVSERYGDEVVELLGVGTSQLAEVAVWRGHDRAALADLADRLRPGEAAPLVLDRYIQISASATVVTGAPGLAAVVARAGDPARIVSLGELAEGARTYRANLTGCAAGCRLVGLAITRATAGDGLVAASVRVEALASAGGPLDAGFGTAGRWQVNTNRAPGATVRLEPGTALGLDVNSTDPGNVVVSYMDSPDVLPVALAGPTPADDPSADEFSFPALAEGPQRFVVVERPVALPRVGSDALLFDLDYAVRSAQRTSSLSDNSRLRYEVWLGADAPADMPSRLAGAGLQILGEESIAAERDQLARAAPALGLRLYLIAGAAALALAVGAVLLTAYVGAEVRRYEFAALKVAGVRAGVLRRGLLREYAHLIGLPLVVGLLAGVAGAALMLPGIPLVAVDTAVGEVTYEPGMGALPVAVVATLVGLLVAVLFALGQVRRATPDRLREGGVT